MLKLRQIVPALCLAGALGGLAVPAFAQEPPDGAPPGAWHHGHHPGMLGPMGFLLHKLDLTDAQKSQIKSILASEKSQFQALHTSAEANHEALAKTPPTDASYEGLVQTAQSNASERVALLASTWKQIYASVLTDQQRAQIPSIVATAEARRAARIEQWKSRHPQAPAGSPATAPNE